MTDDYLYKVIDLADVTLPVEQPSVQAWEKLELELGVHLPRDYKSLITALGSGSFGDLVLSNPASSLRYACLSVANVIELNRSMAWMARDGDISLYPEVNGFLPIGSPTIGRTLFIETTQNFVADSSYTVCWFNLDNCTGHVYRMSVCQFLYEFYNNTFQDEWAILDHELIWEPGQSFFKSRPGLQGEAEP